MWVSMVAAVGFSDVKDKYIGSLFKVLFFTLSHCVSIRFLKWSLFAILCVIFLRFLSQACKLYDSSLIASVTYILSTVFAVVAGELWDSVLLVFCFSDR